MKADGTFEVGDRIVRTAHSTRVNTTGDVLTVRAISNDGEWVYPLEGGSAVRASFYAPLRPNPLAWNPDEWGVQRTQEMVHGCSNPAELAAVWCLLNMCALGWINWQREKSATVMVELPRRAVESMANQGWFYVAGENLTPIASAALERES